jgi:diguanylate cyclase (GGDEF)-like protein
MAGQVDKDPRAAEREQFDVDELRSRLAATEAALDRAHHRARRASDLTRTAIFELHREEIRFANPAARSLFGSAVPDGLVGTALVDLVHPDDRFRAAEWLGSLTPGEAREEALAIRLLGPEEQHLNVELLAFGIESAGESRVQLFAYDVTERTQAEETLNYQYLHDSLTGLPNRLLFLDRVRQALARMARSGMRVAVFFCDLDRFQIVNDSLGHTMGDRVLAAAATRLQAGLRPADTVARFGGDEFVVLCEITRETGDIAAVAKRILRALSEPFDVDDQLFTFSASIGVTMATNRLVEPEDLIRDAAAAMSQAKARGKGRLEIFDEATRARAVDRLQIESALRLAMEQGELRVYYQPMVSCATGRLVGAEALVRWQHPVHGFILPDSFIPIAEDCGLIISLGDWVLEEACKQAALWEGQLPEGRTLHLSVNLSAHQLHDPELVDRVRQVLPPRLADGKARQVFLGLEVTETTLVRDTEQTADVLERLDQLGVRIGIDDFGTGYSSLSYLKRFPVSSIKIDQSFVAGLDVDPDDRSIVTAVVQLAHNLGLTVVAEGVERPEQLEVLAAIHCDEVQGYLYGRPLPPEVMTTLILTGEVPAVLPPLRDPVASA